MFIALTYIRQQIRIYSEYAFVTVKRKRFDPPLPQGRAGNQISNMFELNFRFKVLITGELEKELEKRR